ncbi:hypothetical protein GCM10017771_97060 [Streptomyces capitiformicae]|uniref:Uncharacterized protein n=1 Tax=Streptomyces capitiformicae TaxID=2014920 RepID=A0A918ZX47_9ACTN|nr:hypothetical protein GCM10017771_97060 [Streptomyces capitiformicae]
MGDRHQAMVVHLAPAAGSGQVAVLEVASAGADVDAAIEVEVAGDDADAADGAPRVVKMRPPSVEEAPSFSPPRPTRIISSGSDWAKSVVVPLLIRVFFNCAAGPRSWRLALTACVENLCQVAASIRELSTK